MFVSKTSFRSMAVAGGVGAFVLLQACAETREDSVLTNTPDESLAPAGCEKGCEKVRYSKCEPVDVEAFYGEKTSFYGNARLALITNGTVPCVHVDKGSPATCKFTPSSGPYVKGKAGAFARTGENIGLDGKPGGEFVIAAKVNEKNGTVPCIAPSGKDTAGTPVGVELAGACVIETLNAAANATGIPVVSYASLEVCTSSTPHPDGAGLSSIRSVGATKVYCYKGDGAGLNDLNGTEVDSTGTYYGGASRCHVLWSNGYEVPAAKRPSTKNLPAPGTIVTTTPIAWRPVSMVDVANP